MSNDEETPSALKAHREANGLTQVDLAERLDVSQQTVARWERGTIPAKYLRDLALILHCRVDELVKGIAPAWAEEQDDHYRRLLLRASSGAAGNDEAAGSPLWG